MFKIVYINLKKNNSIGSWGEWENGQGQEKVFYLKSKLRGWEACETQ